MIRNGRLHTVLKIHSLNTNEVRYDELSARYVINLIDGNNLFLKSLLS